MFAPDANFDPGASRNAVEITRWHTNKTTLGGTHFKMLLEKERRITHAHTHALLSDPARLTVKIHLRAPILGAPRRSEPICVDDYEYFSQPPPIIIMHGSDDLDWPSPLISNCKTPPFDAACLFQSCLVRFRFFNTPQHFTRLEFFLLCVQREGGPSALPFAQQNCWRFCNAAKGIYVHTHCVLLIFNLLNSLSPLRGCWHSNGGKWEMDV